jgi:hypothetical protein
VVDNVPIPQEEINMKHFLILGGLFIAASLIVPVAIVADDNHRGERRYRDADGRDYHYWNDNEDREYREALEISRSARQIAHPELVSGTGRACAILMRSAKGRAAVKTGAEGFFAGMIAAFYALLLWAASPGWRRAVLFGIATGMVVLSKFSALGFFPLAATLATIFYLIAKWPGWGGLAALAKARQRQRQVP